MKWAIKLRREKEMKNGKEDIGISQEKKRFEGRQAAAK